MGMLAWVMMGLALWHFTIWLPDRFWGGIVGAFLGALIGAFLFGFIVNGFHIPGRHATDLTTALEAIPGAADRDGAGVPEGRAPRARHRRRAGRVSSLCRATLSRGRRRTRPAGSSLTAAGSPTSAVGAIRRAGPPGPSGAATYAGARCPRRSPAPGRRRAAEPGGRSCGWSNRGPRRTRRAVTRLEIPSYRSPTALALERELGVSHALAQILVRRGLGEPAAARAFLAAGEAHDPSAVRRDRPRAGRSIRGHVARRPADRRPRRLRRRRRVRDRDPGPRAALARRRRRLVPAQPDRRRLRPVGRGNLQRLAERGTAPAGHRRLRDHRGRRGRAAARAAGLELVVTDHHAPRADGALPDCPIVHPAVCGYPCPDLCGDRGRPQARRGARRARTAADDLDLVALATVADLVPLSGENRRLVREGLRALAVHRQAGAAGADERDPVRPQRARHASTIGFRLAPRINAAGRLRRADAGARAAADRRPGARPGDRARARRRQRRAPRRRAADPVGGRGAGAPSSGERSAYVLAGEGWHPGVIGIVASRIVERHHRPAVLIALDGRRSGPARAAASPASTCSAGCTRPPSTCERYGGHRAAAGLTIGADRVDEFRAAFEAHAAAVLTPDLLEPVERVDAIVSGAELGLGLAEELEALEPCGMGNPAPRLLVPAAASPTCGRWARAATPASRSAPAASARGRSPSAASGRLRRRRAPAARRDLQARAQRVERRRRAAAGAAPRPARARRRRSTVIGEPEDYLGAVLAELDAAGPLASRGRGGPGAGAPDASCDRRGESPLAVLSDALAAGGPRAGRVRRRAAAAAGPARAASAASR